MRRFGLIKRKQMQKKKKLEQKELKSRKRWDTILDRLPTGKELIGVEVGVSTAKTSMRLLKARPLLTLIMIDSWEPPPQGSSYIKEDDENAHKTQKEQDESFEISKQRVAFAGERAVIKKMYSHDAVKEIKDKSVDFVFIDGDHSYEGVKKDIGLWLSKIKMGGFLCGHDYDHPRLPGVKKAVDEAFPNKEKELDANRTWFVRIYE